MDRCAGEGAAHQGVEGSVVVAEERDQVAPYGADVVRIDLLALYGIECVLHALNRQLCHWLEAAGLERDSVLLLELGLCVEVESCLLSLFAISLAAGDAYPLAVELEPHLPSCASAALA